MRWRGMMLVLLMSSILAPAVAQEVEDLAITPAEYVFPCDCVEGHRFTFRLEYLYWYLHRLSAPPLLTTGPAGSSGIIGEPGTVVQRGGPITSRHDRYIGVRARGEWWQPQSRILGLQLDCFFLERDSTHFTIRHDSAPVLAVPYLDAVTGRRQSYLIGGNDPQRGNLTGGSRVYSRMELFGQEANVLLNLVRNSSCELTVIGGGRFHQLRERLDLTSSSFSLPDRSTIYGLEDHFQTFNKFFGAQVGVEGRMRAGRWLLEGRATAALGANEERIRNKGERISHSPLQRISEPYGLFILPSNRGAFRQWDLDAVGEIRLNAGFDLTRHIRLLAASTLLLWHGPVRPGDQVQPIDLRQIGPQGPAGYQAPQPSFHEELFWAQGGNIGLELLW